MKGPLCQAAGAAEQVLMWVRGWYETSAVGAHTEVC